jgi:hypothetical protein
MTMIRKNCGVVGRGNQLNTSSLPINTGIFKVPNLITKDIPNKLQHSKPFLRFGLWAFLILTLSALLYIGSNGNSASAQTLNTATLSIVPIGTVSSSNITVTYIEPINVRSGPSSFDYPVIGSIPVGGTAPAIGRSPAGEWIQIQFPDGPRGTGWVYAANVSLSTDALLPIVEPPPTPTLVMTPTLNQTFAAAFLTLPTSTHLPTFTPPPALAIPTFTNPANSSSDRSMTTWVVLILGLAGIVGLAISYLRRR